MDELLIRFWVLASASSLLATRPMVTGLAANAVLAAVVDRDMIIISTAIFLSSFAPRVAINQFGKAVIHAADSIVPSAVRGSGKQPCRRRLVLLRPQCPSVQVPRHCFCRIG